MNSVATNSRAAQRRSAFVRYENRHSRLLALMALTPNRESLQIALRSWIPRSCLEAILVRREGHRNTYRHFLLPLIAPTTSPPPRTLLSNRQQEHSRRTAKRTEPASRSSPQAERTKHRHRVHHENRHSFLLALTRRAGLSDPIRRIIADRVSILNAKTPSLKQSWKKG